LDKDTREPVEISLDGKVVARGTLVAVDDSFGVRITEIIPS
jgi:flagellar motor switch protein FliN